MEWISVEDRLPEIGQECLVFNGNSKTLSIQEYTEIREAPVPFSSQTLVVGEWFDYDDDYEITYWCIPEPPKADE